MKGTMYFKLAIDGIKKNRKLYIPYLMSIAGMVAIFYTLFYLFDSPALYKMNHGSNILAIMSMGSIVMGIFSVVFLFYTNSFLMKKRNKEFALYNILGMNKKNVIRIVGCESIAGGAISIAGGILIGFLGSKFFELALLKICHYEADYAIHFSMKALISSVVVYSVILFVLFIVSSARVIANRPIELLRSENKGEKEPRANWFLAIIGAALLGYAYFLAATISNALSAITTFFFAVIMVIIATYLLFISGSVFICKILKKNKNYYYNPRHFVSLSGMIYRMKRNGAGLASVCILSTMVLVMISSTSSLYIGENDAINSILPTDIEYSKRGEDNALVADETVEYINAAIEKAIEGVKIVNRQSFKSLGLTVHDEKGYFEVSNDGGILNSADVAILDVISLEDYNEMGHNAILSDDEILFNVVGGTYDGESLVFPNCEYKIAGLSEESLNSTGLISIVRYYNIVVKDLDLFLERMNECGAYTSNFYYDTFDIEASAAEKVAVAERIRQNTGNYGIVSCKEEEKFSFIELNGSLFVLGIFLSIAFIGACVLIIYYKQVTEGYEDANGYRIMRNVGMTKDEIKKGINSQMLITFFSPLLAAGVHLAFSFPLVRYCVLFLGITNVKLLIATYGVSFLVFAVLYLFVYRRTVKAYLEIVAF